MKYKIFFWSLITLAITYQLPSVIFILTKPYLICTSNNACLFHENNVFLTLLFLIPSILGTLLCIVAASAINHKRRLSFFCTILAVACPAGVVLFASINLSGFGI